MLTGSLDEFALAAAMAVIYLLVLRFLDVNEREPLWSLGLLFALGGALSTIVRLVADPAVLALDVLPSAAVQETDVFAAIAAGFGVLSAVGRHRGWSEVTGPVDGIVYGAATGLGYATGEALVLWLQTTAIVAALVPASRWDLLVSTALAGLAHGTFGAFAGAGLAAGPLAGGRVARAVLPLIGLGAAIGTHAAHHLLAYGNALGGSSAVVRGWIALALPIAGLASISVHGLLIERRTIAAELADETHTGAVTAAELALLQSLSRRQFTYLGTALTLRLGTLWRLGALHNRQVMLALAKRRAAGAALWRRPGAEREVDILRERIAEARAALQERGGSAGAGPR